MTRFDFINNFYIKNNLKIFPVMENKKLPLIDAWQKDCSSDLLQILYWLENAKDCNIGLPANENNLFIIDIDMHDVNGLESFNNLCKDLNIDNIDTLSQTTPSGGMHYIFKSDDELKEVMNSANCFENYRGIDIRTRGYILVEPSSINGVPYKLDMKEIKEMPSALREFILNNSEKTKEEKREYVRPSKVEKGARDTCLFEYINNLYYHTKLGMDEIKLLAHYFNETVCDPPLGENVVDYKVNKVFTKNRLKYILVYIGNDEEGDGEI